MADERPVVIGTAGHIDHGKTTLVEALTGTNTDRLAEERRRGISIELGFARLELPGGRVAGVVDVPGHRRLVRAMVAGASGIDMYLLVVAADDGVMPQTLEHHRALRALGVERGVVALTKTDAAPEEAIALAREEAAALAPGAPLVEVSARTGAGLDRLRRALATVAAEAAAAAAEDGPGGGAVMHLDRVFSLRGIGTVVTGTLAGGAIAAGDRVRLLPSERVVRVRSVQVHDEPVERAEPGRRVALNLVGVDRGEVDRGDVIAAAEGNLAAAYRLDVELDFDPAGADRRVQVHHGTRQVPARLVALDGRLAQLRLEAPLIALPHDRFVVRRIAPPDTLGGGVVIDPAPPRHAGGAAAERLRAALAGEPGEVLGAAIGATEEIPADPAAWRGAPLLGFAVTRFGPGRWREAIDEAVAAGSLARDGDRLVRPDRTQPDTPAPEPPELDEAAIRVLDALAEGGLQPPAPGTIADELDIPRDVVARAMRDLAAAGAVIRLGGEVAYPTDRLERISRLVAGVARERGGSISLPELRDALRISRKYSQALLEHLDGSGVTVRHGDRHVLRRPNEP